MGYPYDELKRANLVDLLIDYEYKRPAVLVLDDFQVINDPGVFALIKLVVQEHIKNMHIVLITRDLSKLDAAGLYQKQLCFTLTEKSLKFTGEEIQRYFNMAGCMLSEDDVGKNIQLHRRLGIHGVCAAEGRAARPAGGKKRHDK